MLAEQALKIYPDDSVTKAQLGLYLAYTGQAASAEVRIAAALQSGSSSAFYYAGRVKLHHGKLQAGTELLRRAVEGGWSRSLVARDPDFVAAGGEEALGRL